jgi:hypothetical protein
VTDEEERLLVELCAEAVRTDDFALRVAVARFLDFDAQVELRLVYAVGECLMRSIQPTFDHIITTNGDGTGHDHN